MKRRLILAVGLALVLAIWPAIRSVRLLDWGAGSGVFLYLPGQRTLSFATEGRTYYVGYHDGSRNTFTAPIAVSRSGVWQQFEDSQGAITIRPLLSFEEAGP